MPDLPASRRARMAGACVAGALAAAVYGNTLADGFVLDDAAAISGNHAVTGAPATLWARDFWGGSRAHSRSTVSLRSAPPAPPAGPSAFRPLTSLTFALDWRLGGGAAWPFHLTNLALHALLTALMVWALWTLASPRVALAAGMLFALHPLHTEAVAGLVGRADVLATLLAALAWWLHRRPAAAATLLAPLSVAGALLSKESAVLVLPLLALVDVQRQGGAAPRARALRWLGYAAALALVSALRAHALGATGAPPPTAANPLAGLGAGPRILSGLSLLARAATLLVAPFELIPDYGRAVVTPTTRIDGALLAGVLLVAAALALAAWAWRRRPLVVDAVAWLLLPGLFAVGLVLPLPVAFAERWWYLPSLGACVLGAFGLDALAARLRPASARFVIASAVGVAALFAVVTVRRNRDWRSDATLFAACVASAPESAFCQYSLGVVFDGQARDDAALACYRQAATLDPAWAEPHAAAAALFARAGRLDDAEAAFARMRAAGGASTRARLNYARFLAHTGRRSQAERELSSLRQEVSSDEPQQ